MYKIKVREYQKDGIISWIREPNIYEYVWLDSKIEESEEFDEENQCMKEKTRHFYEIKNALGLAFKISFYSENFITKKEFIKKLNDAYMYSYVYEYDEELEEYICS